VSPCPCCPPVLARFEPCARALATSKSILRVPGAYGCRIADGRARDLAVLKRVWCWWPAWTTTKQAEGLSARYSCLRVISTLGSTWNSMRRAIETMGSDGWSTVFSLGESHFRPARQSRCWKRRRPADTLTPRPCSTLSKQPQFTLDRNRRLCNVAGVSARHGEFRQGKR
jgi:hypothetical protein